MTTIEILQNFYKALQQKGDWESFLSDGMTFINNGKEMQGKETFLEGIKRFYSMIQSFEIQQMIASDEKAATVVRYQLQLPNGQTFSSDVAEFFTIQNEKFQQFGIYFDTAPYPPR